MFKMLPDGRVQIGKETITFAGIGDARIARNTRAEGDPLDTVFADGYKLPDLQARLANVTSRDNVRQRDILQSAYADLLLELSIDKRGNRVSQACKTASEYKPAVAAAKLQADVPPLLMELRQGLSKVIEAQATRAKAAKDRLAAALAVDVPKDAAEAVTAAIRAQELRARVAGMDHQARARVVEELAKAGRCDALAALGDDPVAPCVPPNLLAAGQRTALDVHGLGWLHDDVDDADAAMEALRATVGVAYAGLVSALTDAGVPKHLTTPEPTFRGFAAPKEG